MSNIPTFLRPSVKFQEIDLTQSSNALRHSIGAVVGEFERGPMSPTYINGPMSSFLARYGIVANPAISFAHDTVTSFMTQSTNCLVKRVARNALYSGATVFRDTQRDRVLIHPFESGCSEDYATRGISKLVVLAFDTTFVTANAFTMNITDGATVAAIGPVNYNTDSNTTLTNIAAAITTAMNSFAVGGTATVNIETTSITAPRYVIVIRTPQSADLTFSGASVTGGASQPVVVLDTDPVLFDVYAENPGAWSSDIGFKLSGFDVGTRERFKITFAGALVTGNTFTYDLNGVAQPPVTFGVDSDSTLAAIAAQLTSHPAIYSATVTSVAGSLNNDREILVIAQIPGPNKLLFENLLVTGGASQSVAITARALTGVVVDNTFKLAVYKRSNVNTPIETFTVSLQKQVSSLGVQQNIEYQVNKAAGKSINIRIAQNPATALSTYSLYSTITGELPSFPANIKYLAGGDLGTAVVAGDIIAGWTSIADRTNYPYAIMMNAGYTSITIQKHMTAQAETRSDCVAILDAPSDKQAPLDLRLYRLNELDIDSSYAAMYTPDVEIEDLNSGERRFIPPSGPVGATYAYNDRLTNQLGAPAGLNRGKVTLARGLRYYYEAGDEELLHPIGINCIIDKKSVGPTVMGEQTLQVKSTVLSSVHARRILNAIKTGIVDGLDYSLFEPNNEATRYQSLQLGETVCKPIKRGGGLYDYLLKCDDENNTPDVIDEDVLAYDMYLKITRVVKGIYVRGILTRTGADFTEIINEME